MRPTTWIWGLSLVQAVMAAAVTVRFWDAPAIESGALPFGFLLLIVLFAAGEVVVVHFAARGEPYTISFDEAPLIMGLALVSPLALITSRISGSALALIVHRKQRGIRLAFNVTMIAAETAIAVVVYRELLGTADVLSVQGATAAVAAALAADTFGALTVSLAIRLTTRTPWTAVGRTVLTTGITGLANAALGFGVVAAILRSPWFLVPIALSSVVLYFAYRNYVRLGQRYESLATLHELTRSVGGSADLETAARAMLEGARRMLSARRAELLVLDPSGTRAMWVSDRGGEVEVSTFPGSEARLRLADLLPTGEARLVPPGSAPAWWGDEVVRGGAVAAPLVGASGTIGMAMVTGRLTDVRPFQEEDRTLLETLANHTSVSIEKTRLLGKVQQEVALRTYQALHDDLTGLPNRQYLGERLAEALEAARLRGGRLAVVLLDLEGFKEVNDSLGHQAGDAVLQALCRRIATAVPPGATMARFGGDEFVLLLPDVRDADDAVRLATPVLDLLNQPISHADLKLAVGARMGVALYPEHGQDASTLMQRADVAMYDARSSLTRHEIYSPERDPFSPQRLALAGRLREAVGRKEIEVWYQPMQSLRTGEVVAAEALVRWRHPERGILEPADFVSFTDRTGLARALALHVLATAVHQCTAWRERGLDLRVSVNLSVRNLIDPSLAGDVLDLLVASGLPAPCLVLEVTETSIMAESRRSMATLSQLHEMGVRLAVDDFGTGYSSLSRLRSLPVSELKIDKSFVLNATTDEQDAAIVRSTVELGHRLGLQVVAEGAEDRDTVEWLATTGCDIVQGYVISRPRPPDVFEGWLTGHDVARIVV